MIDAYSLSEKFAKGETTPLVELKKSIARIQLDPAVFISTSIQRAYREAKASTERWENGCPLSRFDGIAISWKDLIDVAGEVTTAGSKIFQQRAPANTDAAIVAELNRMGMITFGKTNLTEFAYSGLGLNPHYGTPRNVINADCIPGGSSSGAAVAVGLDIVKISMGTDTAGSIRIPAAFNGLIGFRSSCDSYSKKGVYPLANSLDTLGPLTRSARDCYVIHQLLNGQANVELPQLPAIQQLVFYIDERVLDHSDISKAVKNNFLQTVQQLKNAGAQIYYKKITAFYDALALIDNGKWLGAAEAFTLYEDLLDSEIATQLDPRVRQRLETARHLPASVQINLYQKAKALKELIAKELEYGFLLTPTIAHTAPKRAQLEQDNTLFSRINSKTLRLTMPGSFLDMPCLTMPNGIDEHGLPTGILISGSCHQDQQVLCTAMAVEQLLANKKTTDFSAFN